jgi:hypothetical protein
MKVEPISVSGSYEYVNEYGLKRWKKISVGATVTAEDNVLDCLVQLDKQVEEAYKKIVPDVSITPWSTPVLDLQIDESHYGDSLTIEEQIKSSGSLKVLEAYKFIAKASPDLLEIYNTKHADLSSQQL